MERISSVILRLKDDVTGKLNGIKKGFGGLASELKESGAGAIASRLSFVALTAAVGLAVTNFAEFETKVANVVNLFGGTKRDVDSFGQAIIDISKRVPVATNDLAAALFDVVSAGVPVGESLKFLETSAMLAVAGVTDTKIAVDGLTSVMNAYGYAASDAEMISDKFFAAQVKGKTTIEELSSNIGKVAPLAAAMGISFDSTVASITAMTNQGIKTAEATTSLKAALNSVIKPSSEAAQLAELLGLNFNAAALESKGLAGFLQDVIVKTGGNSSAMATLFGSVEAVNGVLALSKNEFKALVENQRDVENAAGSTSKAMDLMGETAGYNIKIMKNRFGELSKASGSLVADLGTAFATFTGMLVTGIDKGLSSVGEFVGVGARGVVEFIKSVHVEYKKTFKAIEKDTTEWTGSTGMTIDKARVEREKKAAAAEKKREAAQKAAMASEQAEFDRHFKNLITKVESYNDTQAELKKDIERLKSQLESDSIVERIEAETELDEQLKIFDQNRVNTFREIEIKKVSIAKYANAEQIRELQVLLEAAEKAGREEVAIKLSVERAKTAAAENFRKAERTRYNSFLNDLGHDLITYDKGLKLDLRSGLETFSEFATGELETSITNKLSSLFGASVGSFAGGAMGQVVGLGAAQIIAGLFGKTGKTVSQYADEAFTKMVKNTNIALENIGKERTTIDKQLSILEQIKSELGDNAIIPEKFLTSLQMTKGTTINEAAIKYGERQQGVNQKELDMFRLQRDAIEELLIIGERLTEIKAERGEIFQKETSRRDMFERSHGRRPDYIYTNRELELVAEAEELNSRQVKGLESAKIRNFADIVGVSPAQIRRIGTGAQGDREISASIQALERKRTEVRATLDVTSDRSLDELLDDIQIVQRIEEIKRAIKSLTDAPAVPVEQFATGGVVGGSQYAGDRVVARVNSGERIMTAQTDAQLNALLSKLTAAFSSGVQGPREVILQIDRKVLGQVIIDIQNQNRVGLL